MPVPNPQEKANDFQDIIDFMQNALLDHESVLDALDALVDDDDYYNYIAKFKACGIDENDIPKDFDGSVVLLQRTLTKYKTHTEDNQLALGSAYIAFEAALRAKPKPDRNAFESMVFEHTTAQHIVEQSRLAANLTSNLKADGPTLATWLGMDYAKNQTRIDSILKAVHEDRSMVAITVENRAQENKVVINAYAEANQSNPANALSKTRWKEEFEASPAVVQMDGKNYLVKLRETADGRMVYVCKDKGDPNAQYRGITYAEAQKMQPQILSYMQDVADALNYVCVTQQQETIQSSMELTGGAGKGEDLNYSDSASESGFSKASSEGSMGSTPRSNELPERLPKAKPEAPFQTRVGRLQNAPGTIKNNLLALDQINAQMNILNQQALHPAYQVEARKELGKLIKRSDKLRNETQKLIKKNKAGDLQHFLDEVSSHLEYEEQKVEMLRTTSTYEKTRRGILVAVENAEKTLNENNDPKAIKAAKKEIAQAEKELQKLESKHQAVQDEGKRFVTQIESRGSKAPASRRGAAKLMREGLEKTDQNFQAIAQKTRSVAQIPAEKEVLKELSNVTSVNKRLQEMTDDAKSKNDNSQIYQAMEHAPIAIKDADRSLERASKMISEIKKADSQLGGQLETKFQGVKKSYDDAKNGIAVQNKRKEDIFAENKQKERNKKVYPQIQREENNIREKKEAIRQQISAIGGKDLKQLSFKELAVIHRTLTSDYSNLQNEYDTAIRFAKKIEGAAANNPGSVTQEYTKGKAEAMNEFDKKIGEISGVFRIRNQERSDNLKKKRDEFQNSMKSSGLSDEQIMLILPSTEGSLRFLEAKDIELLFTLAERAALTQDQSQRKSAIENMKAITKKYEESSIEIRVNPRQEVLSFALTLSNCLEQNELAKAMESAPDKQTKQKMNFISNLLQEIKGDTDKLNEAAKNFATTFPTRNSNDKNIQAHEKNRHNLVNHGKNGIEHGERMLALAKKEVQALSGPEKAHFEQQLTEVETQFKGAKSNVQAQLNVRYGKKETATPLGSAQSGANLLAQTKGQFITKVEEKQRDSQPPNENDSKRKKTPD